MKKLLRLFLVATAFLFIQCSNDLWKNEQENDTLILEESELNVKNNVWRFPENVDLYGKNIAKELKATIKNMRYAKIDFLTSNNSEQFKEYFYKTFAEHSPTLKNMNKGYEFVISNMVSPATFVNNYYSLTEIQKEYIKKINNVCVSSTTYTMFFSSLFALNCEIKDIVPLEQQERLLKIISVLYYASTIVKELEEQGEMPLTSRSLLGNVRMTRSESGYTPTLNPDSFGASCRNFLAAVWTIAVGEPTPAGEVVAAVATVVVAGVLMYEVVVCSGEVENEDEEDSESTSNSDYCQERFEDCVSTIPDGCAVCLQYCLTNGTWPPYETHKCN